MENPGITILAAAMDEAWQALCRWMEGLSEEEYFWEPSANCWTVHPDPDGHWMIDYEASPSDPLPLTTIAWKIFHLAACKRMYYEYAFGEGRLTWEEISVPRSPSEAIHFLEEPHALLQGALNRIGDADLGQMRLTNWGEMWPTWRIFWTMASHDMHHGAEIGCMRDLYRALDR
jgi:hypothetical protein